jgi:hypothetical protein
MAHKRLKILFVAGWYPSERNPVTGIFVREHAKSAALYNDVVVLYSEGIARSVRGLYQIADRVEDDLRTIRVQYRKSPIPKTSYFIFLWAMFGAFRELTRDGFRPDVIHAHVYSAGAPAVLLGKRYGIPVVITEHFTGFPRGTVRGLEKLKAKFTFEGGEFGMRMSSKVGKRCVPKKAWILVFILALIVAAASPTVVGDSKLELAPLNPAFVTYMHRLQAGAPLAQVTPGGNYLGYIPSPVDRSHLEQGSGPTPLD